MIVLEAQGLEKRIGVKQVLSGLDLELRQGRFLTIFGPNGAGKSTFLRVAAGLISPSGGRLKVFGLDPAEEGVAYRRRLGFLSHASFLYDNLTAAENLRFYAELYGLKNSAPTVAGLLEEAGLSLFANDTVRGFSRGMVQRLAIARAIIHSPDLLFLDEPYTGLDQSAALILNGVLTRFKGQGKTVIMVSHNFAEGLTPADEVAVIARGRVVAHREKGDLTPETWSQEYRRAIGREA